MKVIGVGCGPGMLTEEAIRAITGATLVMGSKRAIELAARFVPEGCEVQVIADFSSLSVPDHAVVLSTGDPMLAGLGYLGGEIIPGISSLQLAASRLAIPLEDVVVVRAHGKDHGPVFATIAKALDQGNTVFIIADPKFSIPALCEAIGESGEEISVALCEDLGYPEERITMGTVLDPPVPHSRLFSVFVGRFPGNRA
ncbi:MAG: cobalt-precorrin-7 (C(5))-methyltransferase [Methanomicrobiales archaeon]|nr:cobalt-precorrin-7 (C(5))-methyltransferase [Methanomicrobiales archaeon]